MRDELVQAVAGLARAIAAGECQPQPIELQALAIVCDEHRLPAEAARVRRWIPQEVQ